MTGSGCTSRCVLFQSATSLSRMYSKMIFFPRFASAAFSFATHAPTSSGVIFMLVALGSPGFSSVLPSPWRPLPHSARY